MKKMRKVKVTLELEIEQGHNETDEEFKFRIEENGCPGTGQIGSKLEDIIDQSNEYSTCWGCALKGQNKIIE